MAGPISVSLRVGFGRGVTSAFSYVHWKTLKRGIYYLAWVLGAQCRAREVTPLVFTDHNVY